MQLRPVRVQALDAYNIVHVAMGQSHTLATADSGLLASWGSADLGQCGESRLV